MSFTFAQIAALANVAHKNPEAIGEPNRHCVAMMLAAAYATTCIENEVEHHWEEDPRSCGIDDPEQQNAYQLMWGAIGWKGPKHDLNTAEDVERYHLAWAVWAGIHTMPSTEEQAQALVEGRDEFE